jgi:glycosyltransferase involved in cell wall biosynthesis
MPPPPRSSADGHAVVPLRAADEAAPRTLVLLPCLDEGPRAQALVTRIRALHPGADVLVVDDGSTDDTAAQARSAGAQVVSLPFNLGYGAALQTGYRVALDAGYARVVQMDGDGQHPPEEIAGLLARLDAGDCDLVVGSRFLGRADYRIPLARRLGIGLFARLTSALTHRTITDPTSGFQAMTPEVLRFYLRDFYPYDYPDADMLLRLHYAGLRVVEAPVVMRGGPPGRSMHQGLRPVYYVYKLLLSMALAWVGGRQPGRTDR